MNRRRTLLRDIVVNAALPYLAYVLLSGNGIATVPALAISTVFPVGGILIGFARERRVQAIGLIVLAATLAGIAGSVYLTSPGLLLAKNSLVTAAIGLVFLFSLLAARPLVFHIALTTAPDAERAQISRLWDAKPEYRAMLRRMTAIWAAGLLAEAALRLALIPLLPIAMFLPISEAMWIAFFAAMIAWSYRHGRRQTERMGRDMQAANGAPGITPAS